jgi:uncharacterized protein YebE (UPF0316 family)
VPLILVLIVSMIGEIEEAVAEEVGFMVEVIVGLYIYQPPAPPG